MKDWKTTEEWTKPEGRRGRILSRIGALLIALAALVIFGTMAIGELSGGKSMNYEMVTYAVSEKVSDIRVEDRECGIRVLPAADGACRVVCPERKDGSVWHSVEVSGDVLRVERHDERKWYQFINISFEAPMIEVYLPEKEYGKLALRSTSGSIRVDEGFAFRTAELESTSGSVRMDSDVQGELRAKSTSGSVKIANASPETLTAESTSGSMTLANLSAQLLTAESTSGSVHVPASGEGGSCEIKTTSGSIRIEIAE